jgi:hypothetical protein
MFHKIRLPLLAAFLSATLASGAQITLSNVTVAVGLDSSPLQALPSFVDNGDETFSSTGSWNSANWNFSWDMTVKPDPFIDAVFGFKNNTAFTQTFVVSVLLPVAPAQIPLTKVGGSVGLTLTDSNFSGFAEVTDAGDGVYFGQNDGVNTLELLDNPFSLTVNTAGATSVTSDFAGLPGPSILAPAAASTIGIVHRFKLTPGDSVAFTSFYIVEAVPEASTLLLVGIASIAGGMFSVARRAKISR